MGRIAARFSPLAQGLDRAVHFFGAAPLILGDAALFLGQLSLAIGNVALQFRDPALILSHPALMLRDLAQRFALFPVNLRHGSVKLFDHPEVFVVHAVVLGVLAVCLCPRSQAFGADANFLRQRPLAFGRVALLLCVGYSSFRGFVLHLAPPLPSYH
jgi:hypothetical protein